MSIFYEPPADFVTLTLDDDEELVCEALVVLDTGDAKYLAVSPQSEDEELDGSVFIYRYIETGTEPQLENVETDEELELASAVFDQWLDEIDISDEE